MNPRRRNKQTNERVPQRIGDDAFANSKEVWVESSVDVHPPFHYGPLRASRLVRRVQVGGDRVDPENFGQNQGSEPEVKSSLDRLISNNNVLPPANSRTNQKMFWMNNSIFSSATHFHLSHRRRPQTLNLKRCLFPQLCRMLALVWERNRSQNLFIPLTLTPHCRSVDLSLCWIPCRKRRESSILDWVAAVKT